MRRLIGSLAVGALVVTACSAGETSVSTVLSTTTALPVTTTTAAAPVTTTGGTTTTAAVSPTSPPSSPNRAVVGAPQVPVTLNPYAAGGEDPVVAMIGQAHLAGVYEIDPDTLALIPELVTAVPTVANGLVEINEDGSMDVTWNLRPEAAWSDGRPVSGFDLAFTLDFQTASEECSEVGVTRSPLPDYEFLAIADKSLRLRFLTASLDHELLFRWVVPSHAVAGSDFCEDWNSAMWPAAGPFVFAEITREGPEPEVRFVRNPRYWKFDDAGRRLPYLDEVVFRFPSEPAGLLDGFEGRSFDAISPTAFSFDVDTTRLVERGADIQVVSGPLWEHINFQFGPQNRNEANLNGQLDFRRAVILGLDRQALLDDAGYPWLAASDGFLDRFTAGIGTDPWQRYQHDPEAARAALAAACAAVERDCTAEPPTLTFTTTSNTEFRAAIAEQVQAQLGAVGISVLLELEDPQLFFGETVLGGTWDVGAWSWEGRPGSAAIVDFFDRFAPAEPLPDGDNSYNWGTPGSSVEGEDAVLQFQLMLDQLRETQDAAEVAVLAALAEELLADQVVIIPLNPRPVAGLVWADEIAGYRMNPSRSGHTWNIETWHRVDGT